MTERARPNLKRMATQVMELLEPELAAEDLEILDVRAFQGGGRLQIRIYVDLVEGGITLGECAKAGRSVNFLMEEADIIPGEYILEVSSPGVRRPLRTARHFEQVLDQRVDLKVSQGFKSRRVRGTLVAFDGRQLQVELPIPAGSDALKGDISKVPYKDILEANLDPDFDAKALINAARRQKKDERKIERLARKKTKKGRPKNRDGKKGSAISNADPATED